MAEVKTKATSASVEKFLNGVSNARRREDAFALLKMMKSITRKPPRMWGPTIVGFDQYHYKYASGHEGDTCMTGFSPRSGSLVVYIGEGLTRDAGPTRSRSPRLHAPAACVGPARTPRR
jgi:hypothetical protein